jgi:hypothetical protein
LAAGWGMKDGRKLLWTSPHIQIGRPLWRHAPAQVSIFGWDRLMSFAFAYIFLHNTTLWFAKNAGYPLLALKTILLPHQPLPKNKRKS